MTGAFLGRIQSPHTKSSPHRMRPLLRIADAIDALNERIGRVTYWLSLAMVIVAAANAIVRYLDRFTGLGLSSNTYLELQWYLFGFLFLVAASYTLKHNAHVRVDVFYGRLSDRGRLWIDLIGTVLFLLPFCILMIVVSWQFVADSWGRMEGSPDPGGLPRYPIKTIVPIAFGLLALQGMSMLIRQIAALRGGRPAIPGAGTEMGEGI